ncbi:hypothetical protein BDV93DRAFT_440930 [Ceratobasidium sp. AG-I]|nr:hypothetical protein BDV93DRAFT_440930 [Ceratobasidium sp. AG-I]
MKDTLSVLLDPATDELLKDYVPPPKKKDDEKSGKDRDGTPARGRKASSVAIESADHTSLEFRAWAKRMFSTVKNSRGEDVLAFGGKPVVVEDDIYETIVVCHSQGNHCNTEETARLVDEAHSWVPKTLVRAFVQECPGCPASNKVVGAPTKPKKRKWDRNPDKTGKRKPVTRRSKKAQDGEQVAGRRSRKAAGKEVSPEESDGEEAEEDELKESGDEGGPSGDVKVEAESKDEEEPEQEAEAEEEVDETEELEMESEDEHVSAAPPSRQPVVASSSVPDLETRGMDVDSGK